MEEYNEILWLFLQENALLLFLLLLLQGVCHPEAVFSSAFGCNFKRASK